MDEILLKKAQQGDRQAFEAVLDQCYDRLFRFAMNYCGHQQGAEDVTQLACIKLAQNIKGFRFESAFSTWLYRLVINCAKDWYRQQSRHRKMEADPAGDDDPPGENLVYLQEILQKVETMGEGYRETLVLVSAEGFSHREAAEMLDVKESTVSWRIHEIRKRLASTEVRGGVQ